MITLTAIDFAGTEWRREVGEFPNRTIYQHPAWMSFVAETQHATPVVAELHEGNRKVGYFTGLTFQRLGLRVLGSPFPGWSTAYMGFHLQPGVPRRDAIDALTQFAFRDLGCAHLEYMDRNFSVQDASSLHYQYNLYTSFEVDLRPDEKQILANMAREKRTNLRRAETNGLRIEEATDKEFADEYYGQLLDVFRKQSLTPTYSRERVQALIKHMLPTGNLLLLRVRDREGRCIATNISLGEHTRGYVWGAASLHDYQILRPNELIFWHTFQYWKARGVEFMDLTGNSDYKARYGAYKIHIPWLHKSKYPLLSHLRDSARELFRIKQRISGRWSASHAEVAIPSCVTPQDIRRSSFKGDDL
jgi:CelD/BcsL family acetyltransferase involved in cellulose biosynthesis